MVLDAGPAYFSVSLIFADPLYDGQRRVESRSPVADIPAGRNIAILTIYVINSHGRQAPTLKFLARMSSPIRSGGNSVAAGCLSSMQT